MKHPTRHELSSLLSALHLLEDAEDGIVKLHEDHEFFDRAPSSMSAWSEIHHTLLEACRVAGLSERAAFGVCEQIAESLYALDEETAGAVMSFERTPEQHALLGHELAFVQVVEALLEAYPEAWEAAEHHLDLRAALERWSERLTCSALYGEHPACDRLASMLESRLGSNRQC